MPTPLALTGARVALRPFAERDLDARAAYQALPEVAHFLYRPPLTPEESRQSALRDPDGRFTETGDRLLLAVVRRDDDTLLGEVVATLTSASARQAEIGWVLDPAHGGHGYATEAARLLLAHLLRERGIHRVAARLDAENTASVRLCERLGMRREAHLVENDRDGDRWGSEYVYALLARELPAITLRG